MSNTNPTYYGSDGGPPPISRDTAIQAIEIIERLPWNEGNVVKYVIRHRDKGGLDDLMKARWYLDRIIERATHEPD